MRNLRARWPDERVEAAISVLLRTGVITAAGVVLLGGVIYLVRHGADVPQYQQFQSEPPQYRTLKGILTDAYTFRGRTIIQLGLLLLILTPVARVVFSVFAFLLQRDRFYVIVTLIVLAVLLANLFWM